MYRHPNSDDGFTKPTLIPYVPTGTLQIPSNVTRISRALNRVDRNGKPQIIYYHSGVGTGFSIVDSISGGLTGRGISENIREVYSFIATNYSPGDEIVLIGFSRGAFTVRSVASMIRDIGLLNRAGMNVFYAIFKVILFRAKSDHGLPLGRGELRDGIASMLAALWSQENSDRFHNVRKY